MAKKKLEFIAERLIALNHLRSVSGSFSRRADDRYKKAGNKAGERLKKGEELKKDSDLILRLKFNDQAQNYSRQINLALSEFEQKNPKAFKQFQKILAKHKMVRRGIIEFAGKVSEEVYLEVIKDIMKKEGISDEDARRIYGDLYFLGDQLRKDPINVEKYLLPE